MEHEAEKSTLSLLYVEDEPVTRDAVCALIRRRFPKLDISTAENGREGVARFRELSPDLVITDVKMPQMHGIEMSRVIKGESPATPIIVTSAHSDMDFMIEAIEIGISRYVMKPIDKDKLFQAIRDCVTGIVLKRRVEEQQRFIDKLKSAVEQGPSMVVIFDASGAIEYVNPKFTEVTGYTLEEIVGEPLRFLDPEAASPTLSKELWGALNEGRTWSGELESRKKSGESYWESVSIAPMQASEGVAQFVAVKEDITAKKEAQRQIELLNTRLEERAKDLEVANKELESFSYTVSHDLRTPLTNINGYCQVILELYNEGLNDQCRDFIRIMLTETVNMNKLIKTLLEFSRVTRRELKRESVDLSQIASAVAAECRIREPQRQVEFTIPEGVNVVGDANLMRVVMTNLVQNAFKYTGKKEEAHIEFGVTEEGEEKVYFIRDDGAGFDMAQADRLFGAFQRLHPASEFKGTGVGLATVQRIIQRHGGRIWAEAEVDRGATFYFTLNMND